MAYLKLKREQSFWRQYAVVKNVEPGLAKQLYDAFYSNRVLTVPGKEKDGPR